MTERPQHPAAAGYATAAGPVPGQAAGGPSGQVPGQPLEPATGPATGPQAGGAAWVDGAADGAGGARRASRGRPSPLIAPGFQPAAITAVLAALIAAAAPLGDVPLAAAVVLLQAVTAAGWFRLNGMWPARQGIALAFLSGVATDIGLLLTGGENAPVVAMGTLGVWCALTLVLHLRNRSAPDERMYALTAALTATALTVVASGHLSALSSAGSEAVTVGGAAVAIAVLVRALPLPPLVSPLVAVIAATGAGVVAGRLAGLDAATGTLGGDLAGGALGLTVGVCALIGLRVASYDFPSRFVHMTAGVALPLTLAAPLVHVLGRALA